MKCTPRSTLVRSALGFLVWGVVAWNAQGTPDPGTYWQVEEVRPGMKGTGRTVIKGTKIETFQAEVLGVLRNTSPGRDLVLCRLAGLDLERTGVIAGMSGSPIYIQGKLLGAVAYAWPFGKDPIAGITPFVQMERFVASYETRDLAEKSKPSRIGLHQPLNVEGRSFDTVTVSQDFNDPQPAAADGLWMVPLRTPLGATGMSPHSLALLREKLSGFGMVPMQGGGVGGNIPEEERNIPLQAGGALSVAMITGDFDLSGIGTVTHIEGKRVYGWGHPFFGIGTCEFPLMTGYVHTIYPRQSLSFKMGSPLRTVGTINADVSTCIAGWLDRQPDMLPVSMTVLREPAGQSRTFNVKVAKQRAMLGTLVFTALTNSVDMEGELPEELTAHLKVLIEVDGRPPFVIHDIFSGSTIGGGRAPQALFSQVPNLINQLMYNQFGQVRLTRVECTAEIHSGRRTADIEAVELETDMYAPGETVRANVLLRPYKGLRQRVPLTLSLPTDLPEGSYTATITDELNSTRQDLRDNPNLVNPPDLNHLFQSIQLQTSAKRTSLTMRLPTQAVGVAMNGKSLPNLPPSMVQILGQSRRTGVQSITGALVARQPTDWVIQGTELARFTVTKNKRTISE
jgi:hypothetical protein